MAVACLDAALDRRFDVGERGQAVLAAAIAKHNAARDRARLLAIDLRQFLGYAKGLRIGDVWLRVVRAIAAAAVHTRLLRVIRLRIAARRLRNVRLLLPVIALIALIAIGLLLR